MNILKKSTLIIFLAFSIIGCSEDTEKPKMTVEEYVNNPDLTKQKIKECDSQIASIKDHEEIYSKEGDCRNAKLALKEISKKRNNISNKITDVEIVH